jgi:pSer/pThr/pTyr-binding forkhead associated (FHA) protein
MERWEFFQLMSGDSASAARLIARLSDRLRAVSRKLAEVTVSKNAYIYTLEDFTAEVDSSTIPEPIEPGSESAQSRITILPASREASSHLPQEGLQLRTFPFSVGRLTRENEPGPNVPIDLRLPDTPPFRLSRQHFSISRRANGYVVLDLGSTLGTQVNGESLGHNFGEDHKYLEAGENMIQAGGLDSPFTFKVLVENV